MKFIFITFILIFCLGVPTLSNAQTHTLQRYSNQYIDSMLVANWQSQNGKPARFVQSKIKKWLNQYGVHGALIFLGETSEGVWSVQGRSNNDASESITIELFLTGFDGKIKAQYNLLAGMDPFAESDDAEVRSKMMHTVLTTLWSLAHSKQWPVDQIKPFKVLAHQNGPKGYVWSVYGDAHTECLARLRLSTQKDNLCWNLGVSTSQHVFEYDWGVFKISKDKKSYDYTVLSETGFKK